jgi:hypothetical protein
MNLNGTTTGDGLIQRTLDSLEDWSCIRVLTNQMGCVVVTTLTPATTPATKDTVVPGK